MMATRFYRSTREAFACERFPAIEKYRRPLTERIAGLLLAGVLGLAGALLLAHWAGWLFKGASPWA